MKKILVIEDEPQIRENLEQILEFSGFATLTAEDGSQGVVLALKHEPDLIICDIMLPKLDGYGVLKEIRANAATAQTPLIFLTAKTARDAVRQGMEIGADDYLTKPFTSDELLKAIDTQLGKQAVRQQQAQDQLNALCLNLASSLPHELHTPLNGIIGMGQLLVQTYDDMEPDEVLEIGQSIYESALRLYRLTQNFVLYADLEMMMANPDRRKILDYESNQSLTQVAIAETALTKATKANRQADLQLDVEPAVLKMADQHLHKVVEELIDNALKFSNPETEIGVIGKINGDKFQLEIINQGRGMSAEQIAALGAYRQFSRRVYEQQGSGLGLVISKYLVELYGGNFTVESIPEQQTTIRLILPRLLSENESEWESA